MDFRDQFRKMSDDVGKMAREVADTSKKATARARVRRMINSCNESLQTIYQEIGSRYYVENQCQPEEQYEGLFQQASDLIAQIDVLKSELAGLDNASICPECGSKVNDGQKFCPECGAKKPEPKMEAAGSWKCSCGATVTGKFCPECGAKKPEDSDGWICSCGTVNKGKFCQNCGAKKPAGALLYRCDKCGWQPEDPTHPPKFCPECGDPFDDGDVTN